MCAGNSLILYPQGNFDYFAWQNPNLFEAVLVTEPGSYAVTAFNGCGVVSDTIQVVIDSLPPEPIDFGSDQFLCEGLTLTLTITQSELDYLWQDGSVDSIFAVTQSGQFIGIAINGCGSESDTIVIQLIPLPEVSLGPDITTCSGQPITLIASGIADTFLWSDGSSNPNLMVDSSAIYSVSASNNCGSVTDTIIVNIGGATENTISVNRCEPFSLNGITYDNSGLFTQVLQNASGCDSILTINAEIMNLNAQIFQTDSSLFVNGTPTAVQWINCATGQAIAGATQTSFVPQISGNYGAVITVGECVDTSNCMQMIISTTHSKTITLCESIVISPNPSSNKIEFSFDKSSYTMQLFTSTGALLYRGIGFSGTQQLDLSSLAPAMYVLQVDECSFKVVKQ